MSPKTSSSVPVFVKKAASHKKRLLLWRAVHAVGIARLAWITCGLSVLAVTLVAALARQADQKQVKAAIDASITLNAKGYAKFVGLNVGMVDHHLIDLRKQRLQGERLPAQSAINIDFKELRSLLLQVAVADANGLIVESSLPMPETPVSIADRPHFLAVKDQPKDELYISEPVLGRISRDTSLQLVRPLLTRDGRFDGAIVASVNPERLKTYFTEMNVLANQGLLSILGTDGVVRFRLDSKRFTAGQDYRASPHWKEISTLPAGIFEQPGLADNIYRRTAFSRVADYPLVVTVGTGLQQQMQTFNKRWNLVWALVVLLAAMLVVVAGTIARLAKEQKRSYGLILQSRAQAIESNVVKSNFLASVSHELRTPLNSILGFSELIRDTSTEPKITRYADLVNQSGTHLHSLVNTILDLAKIESGKMGLSVTAIDMTELLQTLTDIHKVSADKKKLELSLSMTSIVNGTVHSDRTKLVQVINNVISNAIKFTSSGAIFVVMKPQHDTGLLISVIDTGEGIPASNVGLVFERFNTLASPLMDGAGEKGTGLGLTLCRDLLNLMGGSIKLVSEEGHGTTVDIFVPYKITFKDTTT